MATALYPELTDGLDALESECLQIGFLDGQKSLIACESFTEGSSRSVALPLRAIVTRALALDASGLIFAHNHPSGRAEPSRRDIEATRVLSRLCSDLEIAFEDHIIVAGGRTFSFRAEGLL